MPRKTTASNAAYLATIFLIATIFIALSAPEAFADWGSDLADKIDTGRGWAVTIGWAIIGVTAVMLIIAFVVGQRPYMWLGTWFVAAFALATVETLISALQ